MKGLVEKRNFRHSQAGEEIFVGSGKLFTVSEESGQWGKVPLGLNLPSHPWRNNSFGLRRIPLVSGGQASSIKLLSLTEKVGHFYEAPSQSEAEASLIILAADQISCKESAIWFIGWKGLRETSWGTKYEIKEFWRAKRRCIRAKVRLSRYEISAGPHTLLKAAHTPGSIQRIKLFQDAVTCNPVDQRFLSVGLKLWHQEYSNSGEQTSAPTHS